MLTCSGLKDDPNPKYSTCRCRNEYLITSKYLVNNLSSRTRPFIKQIEWKFWRTIILLSLLKIRPDRFTVLGVKSSSKEFWVQSIQYTCLLLMPTLRFLAALSSIFMLYKELRNKMPEQSPTSTRNHCINCMNFLWMLILFQTELSSLSLLSPGWGVLLSFSQTGSDQSAIMF